MTRRRSIRIPVTVFLGLMLSVSAAVPAGAQASQPPATTAPGGASLAEKIAAVYLLVGGAIMLYYGPKERENGQLTMDGKSEAVAGAASIGISIALFHDIFTKRRASRSTPPAGAPPSSSRTEK